MITMSSADRHLFRQHESGASKRKMAKEKEEQLSIDLKKMKSIASFFIPACPPAAGPSDSEPVDASQLDHDSDDADGHQSQAHGESRQSESESDVVSESVESQDYPWCSNDVSMWPNTVTNEMIDHWALKTSEQLSQVQNISGDFTNSEVRVKAGQVDETRRCTTAIFSRRAKNGEIVKRSWLCYSPVTGRVYCYICKLMSPGQQQLSGEGYSDWTHSAERLKQHEFSNQHTANVISLASRSNVLGRIDRQQQQQVDKSFHYWRNILKRCISVIRLLAERGLAFRGEDELVRSHSNGNYLGVLELLAEHDTFLAEHIQLHANRGSGHTNYLSSTICEELIEVIGKEILKIIVERIKKSKYYSVSVDSTPDVSHVDQLTIVVRYIEDTEPVERFVTFLDNSGHTGKEQADSLLHVLATHSISFDDCRGQSYDNAANMSGKYNGMQAILRQQNGLAMFIPCAAHSLNLVGHDAVSCCRSAVAFFDFVQEIYVFFTASPARYERLHIKLAEKKLPVPKRLIEVRWSAHADATRALVRGYSVIREVLNDIADDTEEKGSVCNIATGLYETMCKLETGILSECWNVILERFNATSKQLQDTKMDLNTAVGLLKSLESFVESQRLEFDKFEQAGKQMSGATEYRDVVMRKRRPNVRLQPLGHALSEDDIVIAPERPGRDQFRCDSFLPIMDMLLSALRKRVSAYHEIAQRFGFLSQLSTTDDIEIRQHARSLVQVYSNDLEDSLAEELLQFRSILKSFENEFHEIRSKNSVELFMYKLIIDKYLKSTFPNVEIMLRIYLCLMVSNATGERSFSRLKHIKSHLRSGMHQTRLVWLSLMSIECDIMRAINFDDIINEFASRKARKVSV